MPFQYTFLLNKYYMLQEDTLQIISRLQNLQQHRAAVTTSNHLANKMSTTLTLSNPEAELKGLVDLLETKSRVSVSGECTTKIAAENMQFRWKLEGRSSPDYVWIKMGVIVKGWCEMSCEERDCAGEQLKRLTEACGVFRDRGRLGVRFAGALLEIEGGYYLAV